MLALLLRGKKEKELLGLAYFAIKFVFSLLLRQ